MGQNIENNFGNARFHGDFNQNNINASRDIRSLSVRELEAELERRKELLSALRRSENKKTIKLIGIGLSLIFAGFLTYKLNDYESLQQFLAKILEGVTINATYGILVAVLSGTMFTAAGIGSSYQRPQVAKEKQEINLVKAELKRQRQLEKRQKNR
ncbi:hypothetical protein PAB09_00160 [Corynebacterium sp. SCR221107]|uniref:hypothetical protein n=1 Tax=Corynebacterium sp. SCR221107 TaxID=3017361 RepID=UPI0022EC5904|nr:hypothetical protein [Corynebacterium sp. SCR221107]WBT08816.1 hypothetical protein PAB09_00160 [Corynebacterium sp. SCR221107]